MNDSISLFVDSHKGTVKVVISLGVIGMFSWLVWQAAAVSIVLAGLVNTVSTNQEEAKARAQTTDIRAVATATDLEVLKVKVENIEGAVVRIEGNLLRIEDKIDKRDK